jgi:PAS domain S-box-containing protein
VQENGLEMYEKMENRIDFLLKNTTDPVFYFDWKRLKITNFNTAASALISVDCEDDMKKIFSEELIKKVREGNKIVRLMQVFKDKPLSGGEVVVSGTKDEGILLIRPTENNIPEQILSGIKHPLLFFDKEGVLVYWSEKAELMFGYTYEEVVGKSAEEVLNILGADQQGSYKLKSIREGVTKFRIKGEKEIYIKSSNSLVKDTDGAISGIICLLEDITGKNNPNQKKSQTNLQLSESRFRMLFEQSPLVIQIFNADGKLLKYNNCFKQTWDVDSEQLSNYNLFEDTSLMEGDFSNYISRAIKGDFSEVPAIKYFPQFAEGFIWMRGFIYPVRNNDYSINEIVLILENITDQKKIEESFGIEASYRNAIESSISAGIAVVDLNGKQTYVNDAFCKMVGWRKEELTGMYPPFIYWPSEYHTEIETAFNETVSGTSSSEGFELKFRKKNNELFDVLVIINPLKDAEGINHGWLASVSDISRLKSVEKEIKNSLSEKEVLLKEIHHRVKNNLQIISSLLNLQLNYIKDKEMQMIFKESQNRVMSMALIHQKLYLSKNQLSIDLQEYINELIQHLMKSYDTGKHIDVDVKVNNVSLDNDKVVILGLIVNELISNALQYAFPEGKKGSITVHMNRTNSGISLIVKDNGKGFPQDINYRRTKSLGLQLVNTLVDQLGGNINLKQNNGTEFDILFGSRRKYN